MNIKTLSIQNQKIRDNRINPKILNPYVLIPEDERSLIKKIAHKLKAAFKELFFGLIIVFNRFKTSYFKKEEFVFPNEMQKWDATKKGLFLCIHGLNDHPSIWEYHIKNLKNKNLNIEIKAPYVCYSGNCSLEKAAIPILDFLINYIDINPGKPICILGVSNGARIADYIDVALREREVNIKISTVSGAHYGTTKMNLLNKLQFATNLFDDHLKNEMCYGSENVRGIISSMRKKIEKGSRSYDFYSTTEDYIVTPFYSALPVIHQNESHYLVHGEGHASIVSKTRKHQLHTCVEWMKCNYLKS